MIEQAIVESLHRAQKGSKQEIQAKALKAVLEAVKADGFQDIPPQQTPKETAPVEVKRFSDEAREALTKEGYVIYTLTGGSIRSQRETGRKFWSTWHKDSQYEAFETQGSMHSEVAIKPDALFIPNSNNKILKQQENLVGKFSKDLGKKVKGVEAIMGEAPDYVELAFAHLDATGDRLFGEKYGYNYARTKTPTVGPSVAVVGRFGAVAGLDVDDWDRGDGYGDVFASPLVVPKS